MNLKISYDELPSDFKEKEIGLENLASEDLLSEKLYSDLFTIKDNFDQTQAITTCQQAAKKYKLVKEFNVNFKQYRIREVMRSKNIGGNQT